MKKKNEKGAISVAKKNKYIHEVEADINKSLWILLLLWLVIPSLILAVPERYFTFSGVKFTVPLETLIFILSVIFSTSLGMLMILQLKFENNIDGSKLKELLGFITIVCALLYLVFGLMKNTLQLSSITGDACFIFVMIDTIMLKFNLHLSDN